MKVRTLMKLWNSSGWRDLLRRTVRFPCQTRLWLMDSHGKPWGNGRWGKTTRSKAGTEVLMQSRRKRLRSYGRLSAIRETWRSCSRSQRRPRRLIHQCKQHQLTLKTLTDNCVMKVARNRRMKTWLWVMMRSRKIRKMMVRMIVMKILLLERKVERKGRRKSEHFIGNSHTQT